MNTKLVNSAAGVILASLTQNRTAAGIALALDSAQLLMTPETVRELEELRARDAALLTVMERVRGMDSSVADADGHPVKPGCSVWGLLSDLATVRGLNRAPEHNQWSGEPYPLEGDVEAFEEGSAYAEFVLPPAPGPSVEASADRLTALLAPTQALREDEPLIVDADGSEPTPLRWGLNDVMWGDDDSVIVMLSGPQGEPYWLELEADRAAVLRQDLGGAEAAEMGGAPC